MTTIFESIRKDHQKQRTLIDLLVKTKGNSVGRRELLERLTNEMEAHARAEERHFYRPLIGHDLTQNQARHSISEHKELDDLIETLQEKDFDSPGWLPVAKELRDRLHHHLDEEEHEIFQQAGKVLSSSQKENLATSYQNRMEEVR